MSDGKTVTEPITPRRTPLAMTIPRSIPRVKDIKQRAMKPAMVVADEPMTDEKVDLIAFSMARERLGSFSRCSR